MPSFYSVHGIFWVCLLPIVLGGDAHACRRRLEDILPLGQPRNQFEKDLFPLVKNFEGCIETRTVDSPQRPQVLRDTKAAWDRLYLSWKSKPAPKSVTGEDFPLILESIDFYIQRILEATRRGESQEAYRQSVAMQHVVAELYGVHPGTLTPLQFYRYTALTLEHLPPPSNDTALVWRNRLALLRLRGERWFAGLDTPIQDLSEAKESLALVAHLRGLLETFVFARPHALAPSTPLSRSYQDTWNQTLQKLRSTVVRLPALSNTLAWSLKRNAGQSNVPKPTSKPVETRTQRLRRLRKQTSARKRP